MQVGANSKLNCFLYSLLIFLLIRIINIQIINIHIFDYPDYLLKSQPVWIIETMVTLTMLFVERK